MFISGVNVCDLFFAAGVLISLQDSSMHITNQFGNAESPKVPVTSRRVPTDHLCRAQPLVELQALDSQFLALLQRSPGEQER